MDLPKEMQLKINSEVMPAKTCRSPFSFLIIFIFKLETMETYWRSKDSLWQDKHYFTSLKFIRGHFK
jgi:hypothetical protein